MKVLKLFTISTILLLSFTLIAQEKNQVIETERSISGLSGNALSIELYRAGQDKILEEWEKLMENYKGKTDKHDNMVHTTEVEIDAISAKHIEVAAISEEISDTKSTFSVIFFNDGEAVSSTNSPADFVAAKKIVREFAIRISKEATESYIGTQTKILEGLKEKLEDLEDNQKDKIKEIEESKETIEEAIKNKKEANEKIKENEIEIDKLNKEQGALDNKIKAQRKILNEANEEIKQFK